MWAEDSLKAREKKEKHRKELGEGQEHRVGGHVQVSKACCFFSEFPGLSHSSQPTAKREVSGLPLTALKVSLRADEEASLHGSGWTPPLPTPSPR